MELAARDSELDARADDAAEGGAVMPTHSGAEKFSCRICKARGLVNETYEAAGACGACIRRLGNLYSIAHSGEPIAVFCTEEEWAEHLEVRRARRAGYQKKPIPSGLRMRVFERDGFKCLECGSRENLRADHIHPERHGGEATIENLQTLCRSCNARKGARVSAP